jgi:methionyl-tRNA synthetase
MGAALDATNDDFIRTSEPRHYESCKALWRKMEAAGDIYLSKYSGWYSVRDEAYFDEDDITTTPRAGAFAPPARRWNGWRRRAISSASRPIRTGCSKLYEDQPRLHRPDTRRNEVLSFVRRGLKDLSISRNTFDWGMPVPGADGHVMYVWVDALTNYITAAGYPDESAPRWKYWPADLHVIGKDIVRFHACSGRRS